MTDAFIEQTATLRETVWPTILAVDDDIVNLLVLEDILQQDFTLIQATNGKDALDIARTQHVDLVLLDIAMPGMDGYEVCRQLKRSAATQAIPVVFLTAAESAGSEVAGLGSGAVDYLTKPVKKSILLARVRNHLELARARIDLEKAKALLETRVQERTAALMESNDALHNEIRLHRQTEALLEQSVRKLDAANRVKDEFLSTISHELRTPLNGVMGMIQLARMEVSDPELTLLLDGATQSANDLNRLIDRMLEYAQLDSNKAFASPSPFSLGEMLADTLKECAARASRKSLDLRWVAAPDTPDTMHTDGRLVSSVLLELLDNAIAFTGAGSIVVKVERSRSSGQSGQIHFSVSDTGPGVPAQAVPALFQPFRQADGTSTRRHGGLGLGLALAAKRLALLGGRIWVDSDIGQGATFHFTIPV